MRVLTVLILMAGFMAPITQAAAEPDAAEEVEKMLSAVGGRDAWRDAQGFPRGKQRLLRQRQIEGNHQTDGQGQRNRACAAAQTIGHDGQGRRMGHVRHAFRGQA